MGAVWSALLVGGGLAGALFAWLLRDQGKGRSEMEKDAPPGETKAPGGCDQGGSPPLSPGPFKRELDTKPDCFQRGSEHLGSEPQESAKLQGPSGENCENSKDHVPLGWFPGTVWIAGSETSNSRTFLDVSRNGNLDSPLGEWGFLKGQDTSDKAAPCFVEKLPNVLMDKAETAASLARLDSQELTDHEDWEVVSRHSSWGEIGLGSSLEAFVLSPPEGMEYGRDILVEVKSQVEEVKTEKAVALSSESQSVRIRFQTHYIPSTDVQAIAVTGDHECLGKWNTYFPLQYRQEGLWSHSMLLPAETGVEWKFVVVEHGQITRWEECSNRFLETGSKDKVVHKWWGIH